MVQVRKRLESAIKSRRKWLDAMADEILQREAGFVEAALAEATLHSLRQLPDSLGAIASVYGSSGALDVLAGNEAGWSLIGRSILCRNWCIKIRHQTFKRMGDEIPLTLETPAIACALCHAIMCDSSNWAKPLGAIMLEAEAGEEVVASEFWAERVFEPFTAYLFRIWSNDTSPEEIPVERLGVYGSVFERWSDPREFATIISDLCDYHCRNLRDNGGRLVEFEQAPFDLLPVEIGAIYCVRRKLGLTTPIVDHPLLANPLSYGMPMASLVSDSTILKVEELYRNVGLP